VRIVCPRPKAEACFSDLVSTRWPNLHSEHWDHTNRVFPIRWYSFLRNLHFFIVPFSSRNPYLHIIWSLLFFQNYNSVSTCVLVHLKCDLFTFFNITIIWSTIVRRYMQQLWPTSWLKIMVFPDVSPCNLVNIYPHFRETCCLRQ
jgi:hypothetical protein